MGVTISAVLVFLLIAWLAAQVAMRWGPLAGGGNGTA